MLVGDTRYRYLTGDTTSEPEDVTRALTDAQDIIEEELGRVGFLESAQHTETLRVKKSPVFSSPSTRVYPSATPITEVPEGYTLDGNAVVVQSFVGTDVDFITGEPLTVDLVYTGGYTAATVPRRLERAIVDTAYEDLNTDSSLPADAVAVRLGDAAITFDSPTRSGLRASTRRTISRYRRRRV